LSVVFFVLIFATVALAQAPPGAQKPLGKNQIIDLVKAGMDSEELAKTVQERGIDFDLSDDCLEALRKAGAQDVLIKALRAFKPRPLTKEQVLQLLVGGVASQRAAALVQQRGIDFMPDEEYLETMRVAGAEEGLLAALRAAASAATGEIVVITSPNAEVYLDGELKGRANAQGELAMKAKLGVHALKVSLPGKNDFQQSVTLASLQGAKIEARLVDAPGSIRVLALAGASISLDGASRGSADTGGELVLAEVSSGAHEVRVSARGKRDYRQTVTVLAGQESRMEARLEDAGPAPGTVRENPKDGLKYVWIPSGTFQMGCSPGDSECGIEEKPPHQVTITKGFWIGQTEVTVEAFGRFTNQTGAKMPEPPGFNSGWSNRSMPIVKVSWEDAHGYCEWAGGRLPTEAEWEYAARGGSPGARYGPLDDIAWYADNSGQQRLDSARIWREHLRNYVKRLGENSNRTRGVGQKRANGFGLFDMLGNVGEWVSDWYGADYYQNSPATDPQGPAGGESRVLRYGSWFDYPRYVRVSFRCGFVPVGRSDYIGCRCVWEVNYP
jgi:formylglycine-generating enzyme required for sulfatase activity